jgi:membrane protein required for colicin V production
MSLGGIDLTWIDGLAVLIVALCALLGFLSGALLQAAGLGAIVAGMALAAFGGPVLADALGEGLIDDPAVASLVAGLVCFFVAAALVRLVAALLQRLVRKVKLEFLDRMAGVFLGGLKGLLLVAVVLLLLGRSNVGRLSDEVRASALGGAVLDGLDLLADRTGLEETFDRAGEELDEARDRYEKLRPALPLFDDGVEKEAEPSPDGADAPAPGPGSPRGWEDF